MIIIFKTCKSFAKCLLDETKLFHWKYQFLIKLDFNFSIKWNALRKVLHYCKLESGKDNSQVLNCILLFKKSKINSISVIFLQQERKNNNLSFVIVMSHLNDL